MNSDATGDSPPGSRAVPDPVNQRFADLAAETQQKAEDLAAVAGGKADALAVSLDATLAEVMTRLEVLGQALGLITTRLQEVTIAQGVDRAAQRKTRHLAIGLAISFAVDVILTSVVTLLSVAALTQGSTLHSSQLTACAIGNQSRMAQEQLWGYLFQLSGGAKTDAQRQFLAFVNKTFAPVDCIAVYRQ